MNVRKKCMLVSVSVATLVLAIAPAMGQALNLTTAEKTPLICDVTLAADLMKSTEVPKASKNFKIEISVPSLANPYIIGLLYGAHLAADKAGVTISTDVGGGFMNPASQITQVENALSRKPDMLLINPADPDALAQVIDETIEGGTPVLDIGTLSNSTQSHKLVQDDFTMGKLGAKYITGAFPKGGKGIVMGGPANASWARRRVAGFLSGIEGSDVKVAAVVNTDIDPQEGLTKFLNALQANPDIDWVYSTGIFLLAPQSIPPEYSKIVYVGGGLDNVTTDALKSGTVKAVLPDFPVAVGYAGIESAVRILNGEKLPQHLCAPVEVIGAKELADPMWPQGSIPPTGYMPPAN